MLEYDTHALRLGGEGEVGEDVVVFERASRICNLYKVLVPVGQLHSQGIGEADKGYFIWARRLELTNGAICLIRVYGCYVVADREGSDSVTNDILLLTPYFAALASTLVLLRYKSRLSSHLVKFQIVHRCVASVLAVLFEKSLHVFQGFEVELGPLHRHLLENHVVLGQRARLVRQQELNAAQLLWDGRVAGDGVGHVLIRVD